MFSQSNKLGQSVSAVLALALACTSTQTAQAAGLEDTVPGAIGLGRAASYGRVNDFMAVLQNPANLAVVPRGDLSAELRLPILQACYTRYVDPKLYDPATGKNEYKQDANGNLIESFAQVCNDAFPMPTANIGWAKSYNNGLGFGIGLFTPAAAGNSKYGSNTIVTINPLDTETYKITPTGVETANRQMGMEIEGVIAHLMLGLGYQVVKQLRLGLSGGIGFGSVYNKNVVSVLGGTFKDQEVVNELNVRDLFIPRATASIVVNPFDMLDLYGVAQYQGDLDGKGYTDLTANGISGAPRQSCSKNAPTDPEPGTHCRIDGAGLKVPMPTWEATGGLRFALRRNKRERVLDPMKDEVFDIEVNATWSQTSHVDQFSVHLHDISAPQAGAPDTYPTPPKVQFGNGPDAASVFVRKDTNILKKWKDTWTFRAGADWNVVPEVLALRLGGSYATRAVDPAYMNIDYFPVRKIGAHVGGTLQLGNYKVTLAYAHIFNEEIIVPVGTGMVKDIASVNEAASTAVNEGKFWSSVDVLSIQLHAMFK